MLPVPDACATLRFSTEGMPEERRAQAVRELHLHERTILSTRLEPIEPLDPLPDYPLHVDLTKRTLPGLAVVSGRLSGLRHAIRPISAATNGEAACKDGTTTPLRLRAPNGGLGERNRHESRMLRLRQAAAVRADGCGFQ